jgi:hypothetical protein
MAGKMENVKVNNLSAEDGKKIIELIDEANISLEEIALFINKRKEVKKMSNGKKKEFTKEEFEQNIKTKEEKIQEYMAEHKDVSYRDAVLACLDRSEPELKKEFTAEEIKKRENLKAVENYISANPKATYKEAVRVILRGEELTLEEKLIEEYLSANPGSTYKEAVIESLSLLKKEE